MSQSFDGFGDVLEGTQGIFQKSEGLEAYESVQHSCKPEGLVVQVHCEHDGKMRHMTISWPEIIALACNVSPHEAYGQVPQLQKFAEPWSNTAVTGAVNKGVPYAWFPVGVRCSKCGNPFHRPLVRPAECGGYIAEARRNGWLPPDAEAALVGQAQGTARRLNR